MNTEQTPNKKVKQFLVDIPGIGPKLAGKIIESFPSFEALELASASKISSEVKGVSPKIAEQIKQRVPKAIDQQQPPIPRSMDIAPKHPELHVPITTKSLDFASESEAFTPTSEPEPVHFQRDQGKHDPFATFHKAEVHLTYANKKQPPPEPPAPLVEEKPTPIPLILIALGFLCFLGAFLLKLTAPNTIAVSQTTEGTTPSESDSAYMDALTFSVPSTPISEPLTETDTNPTTETDTPPPVVEEEIPEETVPPLVTSEITVTVLNGSGISGAANTASTRLREANFNVDRVGNANTFDFEQTTIYHAGEKTREAEAVQLTLQNDYETRLEPSLYQGQTADIVVVIGTR